MKIYFCIVVIASTCLQAQNLDSLYNLLIDGKMDYKNSSATSNIENNKPNKCGFVLRATIKEHLHEYSLEKQHSIQEVLERPVLQTSLVSPSGIFRIHFDESGNNQPVYDINDLAIAFDSSYNYEVNILGYPPPPDDGSLGGDNKYDIYIIDFSGGVYGATTPEVAIGAGKYLSYIEIDNSFSKNERYYSLGIQAARVTAAHEFHHAIQVGNYIFRSEDSYYYEITSTSMEEFVYDDVNDYYAYMPSYFKYTSRRFEDNEGYNLAIWNIFLQERFNDNNDPMLGHKIVKKSWELMRDKNYRSIIAIATATNDFGYSFDQELNTFGDWLYFTDERSKLGKFFEEAANYPLVKNTINLTLEKSETVMIDSKPTSINFVSFMDFSQGFADTIVAVLSNSDVNNSSSGKTIKINYTLSNSPFDGGSPINNNYYKSIEESSMQFITDSYIINGNLAENTSTRQEIDYVYPQPFNYQLNTLLNIPTYPDISKNAELNIYSSDMNLVYSGKHTIFSSGKIVIKWNGQNLDGAKLASGVYIYVTKANGKIKKGKFVILN